MIRYLYTEFKYKRRSTLGKAYAKYILALVLFGSNGVVASFITLTSYEIVFWRTLIGSLFLLILFIISRQKPRCFQNKRHLLFIAVSGAAMGLSWMFLYEAYVRIGVGVATLMYYCGPVIVMVLSPVLFSEKFTAAKLLGFLSVMAGMVLVNFDRLASGGLSWGLLCGVLSAVLYAFMVIFNKKATDITGLENPTLQLVFSFATVALFTFIRQGGIPAIPSGSFTPVLLLGLVNTGIGCFLYFSSIPRLPAQSVALCGYLEPLSALVFSAALLGEGMTLLQIAGTALLLGGALAGEFFGHKRLKAT